MTTGGPCPRVSYQMLVPPFLAVAMADHHPGCSGHHRTSARLQGRQLRSVRASSWLDPGSTSHPPRRSIPELCAAPASGSPRIPMVGASARGGAQVVAFRFLPPHLEVLVELRL